MAIKMSSDSNFFRLELFKPRHHEKITDPTLFVNAKDEDLVNWRSAETLFPLLNECGGFEWGVLKYTFIKVKLFHLKFSQSPFSAQHVTPDDEIILSNKKFNFCSLLNGVFSRKECRRWTIYNLRRKSFKLPTWKETVYLFEVHARTRVGKPYSFTAFMPNEISNCKSKIWFASDT